MDAREGTGKRLSRDPLFRARMAYCGPKGIALSAFLAWPQADQDAALAWQSHEALRCPSCGTHPSDYDPDAGGRRHAWHPDVEVCDGCATRDRGQEMLADRLEAHGARLVLTREPPTREEV